MLGGIWIWLALAGVDGFMAVAAGAFGAHAVSDPEAKALLRTGAEYQAIHAVAALACYGMLRMMVGPAGWAAALFSLGALVFAGSLYLLALTGVKLFGAVTPIGGVLMLAGWAAVIYGALASAAATAAAPPP